MNLFMPNIWLYGVSLLIVVSFMAGIGMVLSFRMSEWRSRDNEFLTLFNTMVIGLTMVVPLFAIIWTRGNSIMWIAVLLWVGYIVRFRKTQTGVRHDAGKAKLDWVAVLMAFVVLLGVYALFYYLFFVRSGGSLCGDHVFYANASCLMLEEHVESSRFQSLFRTTVPYHYGDLWLTSMCSLVFGLKPIYTLYLLTFPFFVFLIVLGMAAFCMEVSKTNRVAALVLGVVLLFYKPVVSLVIPWQNTLFPVAKLYIVTMFFVWCALMLREGDFGRAFIAACFLVPFYSTVSAGVLTFVFLMAIGLKWYKTHNWRCLWNEYSIVAVIIALLFFGFYFVQKRSPIGFPERSFDLMEAISEIMLYAAKWSLKSCVLLLLSFFAIFYLGKKNPVRWGKGWMVVAAVAVSCAVSILVGKFLFQTNRDGIQVMTNFVDSARIVCCYAVMLSVVGSIVARYKQLPRYLVYCLFVLYPIRYATQGIAQSWFWPSHPQYTEAEIDGLFELKEKDALFGVFRVFSASEQESVKYFAIDDFDMIPHLVRTGYFVFYELSELDLPEGYPVLYDDSHNHAFVEWVCLQKREGKICSNEQYMLGFVKEFGIDYLIVDGNATLPTIFEDKVTQVAIHNESAMYKLDDDFFDGTERKKPQIDI